MTVVDAGWHTGELLPDHTPDPRFVQGYDIHVLRSTTLHEKPSVPLRSLLLLKDDAGQFVRADAAQLPAGVNVVFFGEFAGAIAGGVLSGGGVSVDTHTGVVEATPGPPSPRLRSFLVTPMIIGQPGGPLRAPPIRVYVHESITEIWLTPSTLTLPGDADGQRLSVLARFDDDTIGDITRLASAPPAAGAPPQSGFDWQSIDATCVRVDALGQLSGVFGLSSCSSTITATLRAPWPTLSASAKVTVVEPWGDQPQNRRELNLVSGPGANLVDEVPNILILPDGFLDTPEDRGDFDKLTSLLVHRLTNSMSTVPFDTLSGSMNYWSVFVGSREPGTTTLPDLIELPTVFEGPAPQRALSPVTALATDGARAAGTRQIDFVRVPLQGNLAAGVRFTIAGDPTLYTTTNNVNVQGNALRGVQFAPALVQPAANNAAVTIIGGRLPLDKMMAELKSVFPSATDLENLVGVVGLPVPAERLAHASSAQELQTKVGNWTSLYGARIKPATITNLIYDLWARLLPDHRLADEKDTAFGLAILERPRAQGTKQDASITWHPLRTSRRDLDKYLDTLKFKGTAVGSTWTAPGSKDRELVFLLAKGARYSGTNSSGTEPIIAFGLVDDQQVLVRYGTGRSMQLIPHPLPRDPANDPAVTNGLHARFAHEMAHSFGVNDEYGGAPSMPQGGVEEQNTFTYGNVTPLREVATANGISGEKLRWRWPRITSAGVLDGRPTPEPTPNVFTIRLRPGRPSNIPGDAFDVDDEVYLRQRPLLKPSTANPPVLTRALEVGPFKVIAPTRTLADHELQVQLQTGVLNPDDFATTGFDAPILFRPMPASAAAKAAQDKYAEIMAQFIRAHINGSGRPLNAKSQAAQPQPWVCAAPQGNGFMEAQPATNLPPAAAFPGGSLPAIPSRIIGAYEGGAAFSCGAYHPAGACIMRAPLASSTERGTTLFDPGNVHGFCHVCRYLIVDRVDPRLHWLIDAYYHTYPQP